MDFCGLPQFLMYIYVLSSVDGFKGIVKKRTAEFRQFRWYTTPLVAVLKLVVSGVSAI